MSIVDYVSVVVPVYNEEQGIHACLASIESGLGNALKEIIVVDFASSDNTEHEVVSYSSNHVRYVKSDSGGRANQMNAGAQLARGKVILFVHADTNIPDKSGRALAHFLSSGRQWGFFGVAFDDDRWRFKVLSWFIRKRSRLTSISTGDQSQFVLREAFEAVNGFPTQPLMEDVELAKRLKLISDPFIAQLNCVSSARKWNHNGFWRTVLLMWRIRLCYWLGTSPDTLHKHYYQRHPN